MRASTILALGAAGLVAAAPIASDDSCDNDNKGGDNYGEFAVNKFVFGCTAGCYYSFDTAFQSDNQWHCEGSLEDKDYVECKGDTKGETYYAYIDTTTDKNILKLQYEVTDVDAGTRSNFYGEDQVYAATSSDADKQEDNFSVVATSKTSVA